MIVKNIIICDDIRFENGNKLSAMGLYGSSLNLNVPPNLKKETAMPLYLALLITLQRQSNEDELREFSVNITISLGDVHFAGMAAKAEIANNDLILHIPVPRFALPVHQTTTLRAHVQIKKGDRVISEDSGLLAINLTEVVA
jgi:hypothetical protein